MSGNGALKVQTGPLEDLYSKLAAAARACDASSFAVYQISAVSGKVDAGRVLYCTEAKDAQRPQRPDADDTIILQSQWFRLHSGRSHTFEGPSFHVNKELVQLQYVVDAPSTPPMLLIAALPIDTRQAADCSIEFDAILALISPSAEVHAAILSPRELEVARWVSEGKTSQETGVILGLSEHTINEYIRSGMRKMGATNRLSFVAKTIRRGLVV
ncbi:MAG: helix-turn-helix transcriptional regulator [Rhizobiaceae bacterium]|nr:helix-turn-helix transcriptional regulator [Rhizobiaceae bacterium]MCZ8353013.1 helix-turn-helix transcriptional regulator [Rhizobium sp.]